MDDLMTNLVFLGFTACMLALVFGLLLAVGHKRNKAFRNASAEEKAALFSRKPQARDIVLLKDGSHVTLLDTPDGGESWEAATVNDYGKRACALQIHGADIVKIEYFS